MSSLSIRRYAADSLAAAIIAGVPTFTSTTCRATFADEEEIKQRPSLRILPERMRFEPFQALEVKATDGGGNLVVKVGEWIGRFELQLATDSKPEREQLEEAVLGLWQLDFERPGVLVLVLVNAPAVSASGPVASGYDTIGAFLLDSDEWHDERVFEKKRDSLLLLDVELPALVVATATEITTPELLFDRLRVSLLDPTLAPSDPPTWTSTIDDTGSITTGV